jgi:hypothetical protein
MKQTAVEWLYERLERMIPRTSLYDIDKRKYFEQAKEMEKEQMCDFVEYCQTEHSKYQETEASWIKELTIDDLFEKRYTNEK